MATKKASMVIDGIECNALAAPMIPLTIRLIAMQKSAGAMDALITNGHASKLAIQKAIASDKTLEKWLKAYIEKAPEKGTSAGGGGGRKSEIPTHLDEDGTATYHATYSANQVGGGFHVKVPMLPIHIQTFGLKKPELKAGMKRARSDGKVLITYTKDSITITHIDGESNNNGAE